MEAALVKHLNDAASKRPKHKHAHTGKLTITKGTLYVMVGLVSRNFSSIAVKCIYIFLIPPCSD